MNTQEPGKRIVSKGEYVVRKARKALFGTGIAGGCGLGFMCAVGAIGFLLGTLISAMPIVAALLFRNAHFEEGDWTNLTFNGIGFAVFLSGAFVLGKIAERAMEQSAREEDVALLTRANIGDLPAPESLVRASEEPMQAQEGVLLRAATEGQQTPSEQLVRAAGEPHSDAL